MDILLVSATPFEIKGVAEMVHTDWTSQSGNRYTWGALNLEILVTGIGSTATALALGNSLTMRTPDLAIHAGIAGSFNPEFPVGSIVHVTEECFADLGVEHADGSFTTVFESGLAHPDTAPYQNGKLVNPVPAAYKFLPAAKGITVNTVLGSADHIAGVKKQFDPDIESMEGAAFFLACLTFKVPFLALRSISNLVEPRNKDNWDVPAAVSVLNDTLSDILRSLQ